MASVDILEKRIAALEKKILGSKKPATRNEEAAAQEPLDVTELLSQTQMMIASALSLREVITSLLQKMPKLNEYLDPSYSSNDLETEAKRQYVMLLYPELKETSELMHKFEILKPVTDSNAIVKINDSMDKLKMLATINLSLYEKSRETTNDILKALQMYNDIIVTIRRLFAELEKSVSELEESLEPKVRIEE